jgi:hypothetical protein
MKSQWKSKKLQGSDDSNDISNVGATTWVEDKTPNLRRFTGNPGVKQIPSDPKKCQK